MTNGKHASDSIYGKMCNKIKKKSKIKRICNKHKNSTQQVAMRLLYISRSCYENVYVHCALDGCLEIRILLTISMTLL